MRRGSFFKKRKKEEPRDARFSLVPPYAIRGDVVRTLGAVNAALEVSQPRDNYDYHSKRFFMVPNS